jgi:uncharacterized membrane protein (UPF0127 family)
MPEPGSTGYAFNRTRQAYLATQLSIAATHWTRLRGLMCTEAGSFHPGRGLWIVPSRGVHTFAMRFPIDVVYLDESKTVVHLEQDLKPWRVATLRMQAASVIELPRNILHTTGTSIGDEIEIVLGREANTE